MDGHFASNSSTTLKHVRADPTSLQRERDWLTFVCGPQLSRLRGARSILLWQLSASDVAGPVVITCCTSGFAIGAVLLATVLFYSRPAVDLQAGKVNKVQLLVVLQSWNHVRAGMTLELPRAPKMDSSSDSTSTSTNFPDCQYCAAAGAPAAFLDSVAVL